jgi:hypothetical protein
MSDQGLSSSGLEARLARLEASYAVLVENLAETRRSNETFTSTANQVVRIAALLESLSSSLAADSVRVKDSMRDHVTESSRTWEKVHTQLGDHQKEFTLQSGRIQGIRLTFFIMSFLFSTVVALVLYIYNERLVELKQASSKVQVHELHLAELKGEIKASQSLLNGLTQQLILQQQNLSGRKP